MKLVDAHGNEVKENGIVVDEGRIVFQIGIQSSATSWPASCGGAAKVAEAFQRMLEGAANANLDEFESALHDLDAAAQNWNEELFAVEGEGK